MWIHPGSTINNFVNPPQIQIIDLQGEDITYQPHHLRVKHGVATSLNNSLLKHFQPHFAWHEHLNVQDCIFAKVS